MNDLQGVFGQFLTGFFGVFDTEIVVVLVAGLFAASLFRPHQIHDRDRQRQAITLLGRFLVVPPVAGLLMAFDPPPEAARFIMAATGLAARLLLAMSLVAALRSLVPEREAVGEA